MKSPDLRLKVKKKLTLRRGEVCKRLRKGKKLRARTDDFKKTFRLIFQGIPQGRKGKKIGLIFKKIIKLSNKEAESWVVRGKIRHMKSR